MPIHSSYIRYFDMVRKHGSIRKASEQLHVASSAVSRQILKLEDELGVSLFERSPSGVILTREGEIFSQFVSRITADLNHTLSALDKLKTENTNKISIAAQESVVAEFLPNVLLQFNDQYPEVATTFTTVSGRKLIKLLTSGEVDIALVFDPEPDPDIKQLITQELRVRAIIDAKHPLADMENVSLDQCSEYPLILPDHSWPLRDQLDHLLAQISYRPNIITSSNSVAFIRRMLASKLCVGFQTIVGIERQVNDGAFVTIPLMAGAHSIIQQYTLCMHKDTKPGKPLNDLIGLLKLRFQEYSRYY